MADSTFNSSDFNYDRMFLSASHIWEETQLLLSTDTFSILNTTFVERSFQKAYTGRDTLYDRANPFIIPIGITIQRFSDRVFIKKEE